MMGGCLRHIAYRSTGNEQVIELDRYEVVVDGLSVHTIRSEDHMTHADRQVMQRLLTCAVSLKSVWIDLQWPTVTLQRQLITMTAVLNAFNVNPFKHLQLVSLRIDGVTDLTIKQIMDLIQMLDTNVQLELWLHNLSAEDNQLCQLLQSLHRLQEFQTIALTGIPINNAILDALIAGLRLRTVRRLMLGDLVEECGRKIAQLINNITKNQLQCLHLWAVEAGHFDGFFKNLYERGLNGLRWLHMVAYEVVPFQEIPIGDLIRVTTAVTSLDTIDIGYTIGEVDSIKFMQLLNRWFEIVMESKEQRIITVGHLGIRLVGHESLPTLMQAQFPMAEFTTEPGIGGRATTDFWCVTIPWMIERELRFRNAPDLKSFAHTAQQTQDEYRNVNPLEQLLKQVNDAQPQTKKKTQNNNILPKTTATNNPEEQEFIV